jgi:hypothetical protein
LDPAESFEQAASDIMSAIAARKTLRIVRETITGVP